MTADERKRIEYFAFVVEVYKAEKGLSGKQAYGYLRQTGADAYIYDLYDLLHVHGTEYLMADLDEYLEGKNEGTRI
ncbi:MAG: DUF3791 domain-containing protein [Synergistaceae bacterium]|jgi:hypothetical protein|nr:DUF3791 domain-containing protein [Synergistaceae bacterium]